MNTPKVIDKVVANDLCIGCGICESECPSNALKMTWDDYGFFTPKLSGTCDSNGNCLDVCPFNPIPKDEVRTEDEIADLFLKEPKKRHPRIGKYIRIYAGHADEFRMSSSSGGIATYVLAELLDKRVVDYIIAVNDSDESEKAYSYGIIKNKKELLQASKTKYYPVTLGEMFSKIENIDGNVAITGVACFVKAIRLAQYSNPILKEKIKFIVGIICGGIKSSFFTEYLASKVGIEKEHIERPKYRIKDVNSTAGDYSFGSKDKKNNVEETIKMRTVGDMWGSGLFKANACDFCDDVTTELSDISVGDAWLQPYSKDGKGANVIVTRSITADNIIKEGISRGKLSMEKLPLERFLESQSGSFNHRHTGLEFRLKKAKKNGRLTPPKRFDKEKISFLFRIVQNLRLKARKRSLDVWRKVSNANEFERNMNSMLSLLKIVTKLNHIYRKVKIKIRSRFIK